MNVKDFPMLRKDIIYFDNGATTFKPQQVIDKIREYYEDYSANSGRGEYDIAFRVDKEINDARWAVKNFINARYLEEIVFTSGTTNSLNMIVNGFFKDNLEDGDEVLITEAEHASNVIPWYMLKNIVVKNIPLLNNYVTLDNVIKTITPKTKVISLAGITNVLGDKRPIKEICEYAHQHNIFVVLDGAQMVPHEKVDVIDLDVDFLAFSGHKMCGPTGIGVLYGKKELLEEMIPQNYGGGMNESFDDQEHVYLKDLPERLEAGTINIAGIIGLKESIKYLTNIGMDNISDYEMKLRKYLIDKLIKIKHIDILNIEGDSGIVSFNVDGIFAQDVAYYLNKHHICVRAGSHCAKNLKFVTHKNSSVRISMYFYNTYEDIDKLVDLLKDKNRILEEMI